jgi:hypothetical protein
VELALSILVGIGLSAACGFRVFVPLLGMSLAAQTGHLELASGFSWIATPIATGAFGVATLLEIVAYFVPWLDNVLDTLTTPAAVVAGTIAMASAVTDVSPFLQWTLGVIAGGGAAGGVQALTVATRGASSVTTAGLANPLLSLVELGASLVTTVLAVLTPVLAVLGLTVTAILVTRWIRGARQRSTPSRQPT